MVATESFGPMDGKPWTDQTQWFRHAPQWASSGIPGSPATAYGSGELGLSVAGLVASVLPGHSWVRGCGYELSGGTKDLPVAANTNTTLYRRDRIVVRRDIVAKTCGPVLLTGTPLATPVAPALQRNDAGQWDLPLFSFNTPPASGTVLSALVDERAWVGDSGLLRFPTAAARDAYFPSPSDGLLCWTADAGYWAYRGGWKPILRDTDWQTFAPDNVGWTPVTSGGDPGLRYRVINGVCHLAFHLNGVSTWPSGVVVFTVPVHPDTTAYVRVTKDNSDGIPSGQLRIGTNGVATLNISGQAGNDIYGSGSFPLAF